ncbi:MAG: hypothetical protein ACYC4S_09880 [Rhodoferax sp.]
MAVAIQNINMTAFWNQVDPTLARYAGYALIGAVVLALLRRLKHPRWKVSKTRSRHYRCLSITFPFGCNVPDENTPVGKADNGSGHD